MASTSEPKSINTKMEALLFIPRHLACIADPKSFFFFLILKGSIRAFSSWHYYVQAISKVTDDNLQAILSTNNIFCVLFRVVIAGNDLLRYSKIVTSLQLKHKRSFICYLYCASTAWRLLNTINLFSIALPFLFSYRMYIKNVWLQQI